MDPFPLEDVSLGFTFNCNDFLVCISQRFIEAEDMDSSFYLADEKMSWKCWIYEACVELK